MLWMQGEKYFLLVDSATQGSLIEEVNFDKLDTALTIYPVSDVKMMYTIHQFVVSRLLNATHHEMQKLKWSLDRMNELLPRSHHDHHQATYGHNTKVVSTNDIVSWKLINHNSLMSDEENLPTRDIPEIWSSELETMMNKAVQYLDAWADAKQILYKKIVNAYWRVDPMVGIHYIIDFEANKRDQDGITQPNRHRVTFKRPLNVPEMSSLQPTTSQYVTIAVCMTSEHISKLQEFMRRLEAVLDYDQRVSLLVVQMKSASEKQNPKRTTSVIDPRSILSLYKSKYHLAYFTVIDSPALISRSHSVSILLHQLRPGEILFLADLDLDFDENFINHCRNIPLQGQQAYFPIVFAQNSPSLLALFNHSLLEHSVSSHSGHWLVDSYSTACIYAADLLAASTQQSELKGIPNEVDMQKVFKALLERKYGIIRSPDKHLKQTFTLEKSCSLNFIGLTYDSCDETMETYGTHYLQTQLSELLFDHEGEFANKY